MLAFHQAALLLLMLAVSASCQNTVTNHVMPCTFSDSSGDYDLTPMIVNLTSTTNKAQLYSGVDVNGYYYYANICNVVSSDTGCTASEATPVCQLNSAQSQSSPCGVVTAQTFFSANETWAPDGGVEIWYTNGESCPNSALPDHTNRTSIFHIYCGDESLAMSSVYEDSCHYEIYISSPYGCPSAPEVSTSAINGTVTISSSEVDEIGIHLIPFMEERVFTVTATSNHTVIDGVVNSMLYRGYYHSLYIEAVLSSTNYSTSLGVCTFGVACDLGEFTLDLELEDQITADDDADEAALCLQGISLFAVAGGSSLLVKGERLFVAQASDLEGLTAYFKYSDHTVKLNTFEFWPSTGKLTYYVESERAFFYTLQCSKYDSDDDDDDNDDTSSAVCDVVDPTAPMEESLFETMESMLWELVEGSSDS